MVAHSLVMERREAYGGTLVLGGGFAGSYVARLLATWRKTPSATTRRYGTSGSAG
jgi:hypothetical protein